MEPDPAEMKALDDALLAFDDAYVNVVQAVRRIKLIYEIGRTMPAAPSAVTEMTGNFCPRCNSCRLDRKGAGCVRCLDCQFDLGCGG